MRHNVNLSLNVAFVRNDPHAMSTAGWRPLIFSPCGVPACVTLQETPHSRNGNLVCIRVFMKFSSVLDHISSYEHFLPKYVDKEGRPEPVVEV